MKKEKKEKSNFAQKSALGVFEFAVKNIPAYRKFIKQYGISPGHILKTGDFNAIPISEKHNYLRAYKPDELVASDKFPSMISVSSGSSGKPYYWPRGDEQEHWGAHLHRVILNDIFKLEHKRTLAIVCFSMGNWIAGTFTLASLREISRDKNSKLTIITPGIDRDDVVATLRDFATHFDSVVILGYPPFLMDVVLAAKEAHVELKKLNIHFILAGENFSEKWRSMLCKQAGVSDKLSRSVSIYGTADAGSIGHETPFTIAIRRLAVEHKKFHKELFGDISFIPTIVAYYPKQTYFELINGELVFTTQAGIPLVRYNIKDHGLLLTNEYVISILKKLKLYKYLPIEARKWKNQMIVLKGRKDVSVTFYALNIYPENLKSGLEDDRVLGLVTGKYIVTSEQTKDMREQKLKIAVELKQDVRPSDELGRIVGTVIFEHMIELNTEYRKLYNSIHEKALPEITLVQYGHEQFIIKKAKHKWVTKTHN